MSWFLRAFVSMGKKDCILFQTRPKWMLNFMLKLCCRNRFKNADLFCHLAFSFNRMARLHNDKAGSRLDCYQLQCIHWPPNSPYLPCLGSYAWTLQVISTQAVEHRWAQESYAVDMGPAATRLDQQSDIELPEKTSGLCESWWWTLRTYTKMNYLSDDVGICNNSQCFLTMKITSCCWLAYSVQNWKYAIEYLYSHNFGEN